MGEISLHDGSRSSVRPTPDTRSGTVSGDGTLSVVVRCWYVVTVEETFTRVLSEVGVSRDFSPPRILTLHGRGRTGLPLRGLEASPFPLCVDVPLRKRGYTRTLDPSGGPRRRSRLPRPDPGTRYPVGPRITPSPSPSSSPSLYPLVSVTGLG